MGDLKKYEYIWLDGFQPEPSMRSKIKVTDEDTPPEWSFDGSSTQQAEGDSSDCLLLPVQTYESPVYSDFLVMTQVHSADHKTHPSNTSCLLYTSPSPRDLMRSRMPSSA